MNIFIKAQNYYMLWSGYVFSLMLVDTDIQQNNASNKTKLILTGNVIFANINRSSL